MKQQLSFLLIFLFGFNLISFSQENLNEEEELAEPHNPAEFPGGTDALMIYLMENVRYPEISSELGDQGKVFVSFIVEKDGSITNIKTVKGVSKELNEEAERVVREMPNWKPASMDWGETVRATAVLPFNFVLDTESSTTSTPEIPAQYSKGEVEMKNTLEDYFNSRYLPYDKEAKGKFLLNFIVTKRGKIDFKKVMFTDWFFQDQVNDEVLQSLIQAEIYLTLKRLKKWKPAMNKSKKVDSLVTVPIMFYKSRQDKTIRIFFER